MNLGQVGQAQEIQDAFQVLEAFWQKIFILLFPAS